MDAKPCVEQARQAVEQIVALLGAQRVGDIHMRREDGETGGDLPDMEIVRGGDARLLHARLGDASGVQAVGSRFEQDAPGRAHQGEARPRHQRGDQRGERVEAGEARDIDQRVGDGRRDEGV